MILWFAATSIGLSDNRITWEIVDPSVGTVDANGVFSAVGSLDIPYVETALRARSVADATLVANATIRVHQPIVLTPATTTVAAGNTFKFASTLTGVEAGQVVWSASSGTIQQDGTYTAPPQAGSYTVTLASTTEPGVLATATVVVPVTVSVDPVRTVLPVGFSQGFTAKVSGDPDNRVTWSVIPPAGQQGGTINQYGVFTPPNQAGEYQVVATSQLDSTKKAIATVTVPVTVKITPELTTVKPGASVAFKVVSVNGITDQSVTWSAEGGSMAADGTYTAPTAMGTYRVTATSVADARYTATATVRVTATGQTSLTILPGNVRLNKGGSTIFTANVNGASNSPVTWTASGGTIDGNGVFTAPNVFGTYAITARSVEDPTQFSMATATVSALAGTDRNFVYDANGNLLDDGVQQYTWDAENRLVSIIHGARRSEFQYDDAGQRMAITEKEGGAITSDRRYLWDGAQPSEERSADGSAVLRRFYAQGFIDNDGTALFYTRDHLGSIRELVDMQQNVRARYDYDPYGRMTKVSGDRDSIFGYAGMQWHAASGLNLTQFRAYDPELGRWISRDPLGEKDGANTYLYVHNNPILFTDPLGLFTTQDFVDFSAGFGDKLTLGGTHWLRNKMGLSDRVNECSAAYQNGGYAGIAALTIAGGYLLAEYGIIGEVNLWLSGEHAFFTGMNGIEAAALAAEEGAVVLPDTMLGQALTAIGESLESSALGQYFGQAAIRSNVTNHLWRILSYAWAATSGDKVHVFIGRTLGQVWTTVEEPLLNRLGTEIIRH